MIKPYMTIYPYSLAPDYLKKHMNDSDQFAIEIKNEDVDKFTEFLEDYDFFINYDLGGTQLENCNWVFVFTPT